MKEPKNEGEPGEESTGDNLSDITNTKKELEIMKLKSQYLVDELKDRDTKNEISENKSEQNVPLYEEEFDLRKMANGARDKNRSEDINIDYPGIQGIKDKLVDLEFKYKNLVEQVKILIGNITFSQKIKPQISQICQLIGYSPKTIGRILTSTKDKKKLLGV